MKKRLSTLCDNLLEQSEKTFGHWDTIIGFFLFFILGTLSFFFQSQLPVFLFVYLQYKFWSIIFLAVSFKLRKKDHSTFDLCTVSVLVQMIDLAIILALLKISRRSVSGKII